MNPALVDVEVLVAEARADPSRRSELEALMLETHPLYEGLGESSALRTRGWVMAAFGDVGMPPGVANAVLETLNTALDAFSVAAAARAARGVVTPSPDLTAALIAALVRMRGRDDSVSFAGLRPHWPDPESTTALTELLRALRAFGSAAHSVHPDLLEIRRQHAPTWSPRVCAELDLAVEATARAPLVWGEAAPLQRIAAVPPGGAETESVELEDQAGAVTTFGQHFRERRHIVAFFYTRCGNPVKCSATVTRLAELARRLPGALPGEEVGVAGISYDPGFDTPERLAAYGHARSVPFSENVRLFRAPNGHGTLLRHFDLNVGYAGTLVNQHAVELYLVDTAGRTVHAWTRMSWTVEEVLDHLSRTSSRTLDSEARSR